ncbi:hydroxymethylglutaryl-CoA lyase [Pantoea endophytica]|uniref:hydroxymethylglutaryl-CoA lyase n=1 Tax=Pantoea endophytica TaxID=92488 RepID=UPI002412E7B5|nr:hydroxymethylglutaryl-CoA lyase [Pantoea endophytica]
MSNLKTGGGKRIFMQEVCPRDGLQNEAVFVPTAEKIALVNRLSQCGFAKVEVTSFTSPKAIPALSDAEEVMKGIRRTEGVEYSVLVPNMRGAERAMACQIDEANLVMSASESHNFTNLRMGREASFNQLSQVIAEIKGSEVAINVSLSAAFGCPFEGDVPENSVMNFIDRFASLGVRGITLCDTTGMAYPTQVASLCQKVKKYFPELETTLHFHDTRGLALANTLAALSEGIDRFDASTGGLGGCPYAPGASGNVCTEDMVHMLTLMGYETQVDLPRLMGISRGLASLIGHEVHGSVVRAGKRDDLHVMPESLEQNFNACRQAREQV